jgi:hypothetical protein
MPCIALCRKLFKVVISCSFFFFLFFFFFPERFCETSVAVCLLCGRADHYCRPKFELL